MSISLNGKTILSTILMMTMMMRIKTNSLCIKTMIDKQGPYFIDVYSSHFWQNCKDNGLMDNVVNLSHGNKITRLCTLKVSKYNKYLQYLQNALKTSINIFRGNAE